MLILCVKSRLLWCWFLLTRATGSLAGGVPGCRGGLRPALFLLSRERLRRVPFKNLLWYSFPYHHHLIIISSSSHHHLITSSSSHHHHLLLSLSLFLSSSFLFSVSLSLALLSLLFSAHRSGVGNHAQTTLCGNPAVECQKLHIAISACPNCPATAF